MENKHQTIINRWHARYTRQD